MSGCKSERVNIEFLVKLMTSVMETFQLSTEAYGEDCMPGVHVFEWRKQFSEGREGVRNDQPGRSCTAVTDGNIEKVRDVILKRSMVGYWSSSGEGAPTLLATPHSQWLIPLPKDQVSAQRNPFLVGRKCESKSGWDLRQSYRTWSACQFRRWTNLEVIFFMCQTSKSIESCVF